MLLRITNDPLVMLMVDNISPQLFKPTSKRYVAKVKQINKIVSDVSLAKRLLFRDSDNLAKARS